MYQYQKDYPRPQLVRKSWENLNGEWDFAFDDKKEGITGRWQEDFPQGKRSWCLLLMKPKKAALAVRRNIPEYGMKEKLSLEKKEEKRYLLHFEGCDFYTKVWGERRTGRFPHWRLRQITFDVTELLIPGREPDHRYGRRLL